MNVIWRSFHHSKESSSLSMSATCSSTKMIHYLSNLLLVYLQLWSLRLINKALDNKSMCEKKPNCWTEQMLVDAHIPRSIPRCLAHTCVTAQHRGRCRAAQHSPGLYIRDPLGPITVAWGSSYFPVSAKQWSPGYVATVALYTWANDWAANEHTLVLTSDHFCPSHQNNRWRRRCLHPSDRQLAEFHNWVVEPVLPYHCQFLKTSFFPIHKFSFIYSFIFIFQMFVLVPLWFGYEKMFVHR